MIIPVFIITGFLGSGKTTLLINSVKKYFENRNVAIIVNEFGEIGVDGKILKNVYSNVLELSEGCICCSIYGEFEKAIKEIKEKYNPDVLFVETSGSAEPFPVMVSLQSLDCFIEAVICVVDAKNFEYVKNNPTFLYQLGSSNIIVLNKVDLINEEYLTSLTEEVKKLWDVYSLKNMLTGEKLYNDVKVFVSKFGNVSEDIFFGSYSLNELTKLAKGEHNHFNHSEFNQQVKIFNQPLDYKDLENIFKSADKSLIRAKGIVKLKNIPYPVVVNYVFGNFEITKELPGYQGENFIVFISKKESLNIELKIRGGTNV